MAEEPMPAVASAMLCVVCKGSGSILTIKRGLEWWQCPGCGGAGTHDLHGPPTTHQARRSTTP